jgi:hypothetical protein
MIRLAMTALLAALCASCGSRSLEAARLSGVPQRAAEPDKDRSRCERLDRTYRRWATVTAVAGGVAAGAGAGLIPESEDPAKTDRRRVALGTTAIVSGAVVAGGTVASTLAAQRWAKECQ